MQEGGVHVIWEKQSPGVRPVHRLGATHVRHLCSKEGARPLTCASMCVLTWHEPVPPHLPLFMSDDAGVGGRGPKLQEGSVRLRAGGQGGQREPETTWGHLFTASELPGPARKIPGPKEPEKDPLACQQIIRGSTCRAEKGGSTLSIRWQGWMGSGSD